MNFLKEISLFEDIYECHENNKMTEITYNDNKKQYLIVSSDFVSG